jgi:hypothetical protein
MSEFGNGVSVSGGPNIKTLTVDFQSYGCSDSGHWNSGNCVTTPGDTFTIPQEGQVQGITANLYEVNDDGSVGALLVNGTAKNTDPIPYRPSADPSCTDADAGKFRNAGGFCVNSLSHLITFDFGSGATIPPDGEVIWTVTFNTSNSGYVPLGALDCRDDGAGPDPDGAGNPGCGYDSLNVGALTYGNAPYAGGDLNADDVIWNQTAAPIAGLDPTPDWTPYTPLAQITTG